MKKTLLRLLLLILLSSFLVMGTGCRSQRTEKRPLHVNPNLDWQAKFKEQTLSLNPPEGTIPWGDTTSFKNKEARKDYRKADKSFYFGKNNNGSWVSKAPVSVDDKFMKRGKERFEIYCAACHTKTGDGTKSQISKRGWVIPNITLDVTLNKSDGELFDIVSNGVRTMPGYKSQINESDRWAIVVYLRALQKVSRGNLNDVPQQLRNNIK